MAASTDQVASKCIDGYGSAIGMPQLCGDWMANQIFWLVVTLVVIFLILSRIALPRIAEVLADRQSTITNYLTASEELKSKAEEAERAYTQALNDARSEASRLLDASKAEMKKELQAAINKADAEISVKVGESEKSIAEIRKNAMASIEKVAKDTAKEIVVALGTKADTKAINAAVSSKMKG
jgi:F-type H+-transporting ATPase subunit b